MDIRLGSSASTVGLFVELLERVERRDARRASRDAAAHLIGDDVGPEDRHRLGAEADRARHADEIGPLDDALLVAREPLSEDALDDPRVGVVAREIDRRLFGASA